MLEISAIILAAGIGTRMKSKYPKVLHKICEKPIIDWVTDASHAAGVNELAYVIGAGADMLSAHLGDGCRFYIQKEQLGTGHAVMAASEFVKEKTGNILILYGDVPLLDPLTIKSFIRYHEENGCDASVLTAYADDPTGYGRIIRDDDGNIKCITEHRDATEKEKELKEINSGIMVFKAKVLLEALDKIDNKNAQNEYYLTDTVKAVYSSGMKTGAYTVRDFFEITGINDRLQLAWADKMARKRINEHLMLSGVTITDPECTYIGPDVRIEEDTVILPGCRIIGKCDISGDVIIGPGSTVTNSTIGRGSNVEKSTVANSRIGCNTHIGPYSNIRPESDIGDDVRIGDFVEIKKSKIGSRTKISHLTYVGDAIVGENCNFGCGVVVVNYDGKKKNLTKIGDNVFIGCNVNLIAPIEIEKDTFIAAGSTITKRVPEKALAIAREKQTNILNWVERKDMFRK